jgi:CheY-like chemotaxis protein
MLTILIVEDDPILRKLYAKSFKKKGFQTIEVADGQQAINIYEQEKEKPHIILLDYRMPIINGLEVTETILQKQPQANILMITGDPTIQKEDVQKFGIRFREKPISLIEIMQEINSFIQH